MIDKTSETVPNSIEIVRLTLDRWQEYKAIRLRSLKEEPHAFGKPYDIAVNEPDEVYMQQTTEGYAGETNWKYFAEEGDKLVGMIVGSMLRNEENVAGIFSVYVAPEARGKGVSKKLFGTLLNELKTKPQIKKIKLTVNKNQIPAVRLYKSFGFQVVGEENVQMGDGNYYDEYLMELSLEK